VGISGATSSSYVLQASDVGSTIRSVVTATNAGGSTPATSAATSTVAANGGGDAAPANTVGPYFTASVGTTSSCSSGCSVVGQTLGVSTGTWANSPTSYTYQWDRCTTSTAQPPTTGSCSAISGATSSTYTVQSADVGHALVPIVTAINGGGSTSTGITGTCDTGEMLGVGGGTVTSSVPTSQPAGCSPISAVAATTTSGEKFCTNAVTTCGYADPLNQTVGVPAGTTLSTTAGNCATYANGGTISSGTVTINGCEITGAITVTGGNVTIENSNITMHDNTQSTGGVVVGSGAGSVVVKYDTIHGTSNTNTGSLAFAVYERTNAPAITEDHVFTYDADRILMNYANPSGTSAVTNSFCWNNSTISGEHYECIYNGPPSNLSAKNSVLINQNDQTAVIFNDSSTPWESGTSTTVDVENDLIGGGDYCIYGGGGSGSDFASNADTYLNNRFSRAIYSTCAQFGLSSYDTSTVTESGNIWDDTGATASP
jgi:hypothetical protein